MVCEHEYMNISPPIIELATALDFSETSYNAIEVTYFELDNRD